MREEDQQLRERQKKKKEWRRKTKTENILSDTGMLENHQNELPTIINDQTLRKHGHSLLLAWDTK